MVKEVKYVVSESLLMPDKIIFAGTFQQTSKRNKEIGLEEWRTRGEVTDMAIKSVFNHFIARTKKENPKGKGLIWNFKGVEPYQDYKITLEIRKTKSKDSKKN